MNEAMTDEEKAQALLYGFRFGPVLVWRYAGLPEDRRVVRIAADEGDPIDIYISPTGRSLRVFRGGKELK